MKVPPLSCLHDRPPAVALAAPLTLSVCDGVPLELCDGVPSLDLYAVSTFASLDGSSMSFFK